MSDNVDYADDADYVILHFNILLWHLTLASDATHNFGPFNYYTIMWTLRTEEPAGQGTLNLRIRRQTSFNAATALLKRNSHTGVYYSIFCGVNAPPNMKHGSISMCSIRGQRKAVTKASKTRRCPRGIANLNPLVVTP